MAKMIGAIGMPEQEGGAIKLFPCPANDRLTVQLDKTSNEFLLLDVFSADGRSMQRTTVAQGIDRTALDVAELAQGSYLLRIAGVSGEVLGVRSFQVER